MNQTTDWMTGEPLIPLDSYSKLKKQADTLANLLSELVNCGGISPEDLYNDARDALCDYKNQKL